MTVQQALARAVKLGEPNPHLAAQATFGLLSRVERDELALAAYADMVRERFQGDRRRAQRESHGTLDCAFPINGLESRWAYLRDMTRTQVQALAGHYRQRQEANGLQAERFEALDRAMARRKARHVADLDESLVDRILSGDGRTLRSVA